jgi:probable F420-dependent oxidoreductase
MKFWASTAFTPPDHFVALAHALEAAGVHGLLMADHLFYPEKLDSPYPYSPDGQPIWAPDTAWPDVWVTIGAMAAVTTTLRFGTSVYIAPARDVFTVAKAVSTAAVLSHDRVSLGLGAGWMREEFEQTGQSYANRGKRTDEMIEALRVLWTAGAVEFHGTYYDFGPLHLEPSPSRPIPIWCGGHSDAALRRAARYCDGWIGTGYSEDDAVHYVGELQRHRKEAGRFGEPFDVILGLFVPPVRKLHIPPTTEAIARWEAHGVTGLLCMPWLDGSGATDLAHKVDATLRFGAETVAPLTR